MRRQLGVADLEAGSPSIASNASPLRPSQALSASTPKRIQAIRPIDLDGSIGTGLEQQLAAMNQETLEEQVKSLIKDNYDLKMQSAADYDDIEQLSN